MDYLKELWNLYEDEMAGEGMNVVDQPELAADEPSSIYTPQTGDYEHPVIQQRKELDNLRAQGMDDIAAHEAIHGQVSLSDPDSKAKLAATLHRIQTDDEKRGIKVDKNAEYQSLLARDQEVQNKTQVTANDLKTPMPQEVPDRLETDTQQQYGVDNQQEEWYNFDMMYLQKYGRA